MIKIYDVVVSAFLVAISGFVSGMTVGMLSIDPIQLRVLQDQGTPYEQRRARKLERMLSQHHLVLVTLLLANSIALEALPIFLNKCVSEIMAVALSVTLILLFGEIIPQAACTGKRQMAIVMWSVPLVQCLMTGLWVLSFPIARLLDYLVGESEGQTLYARSHLKALIRLHQKETRSDGKTDDAKSKRSDSESALCADEVVVIEGALDLASKIAAHVMVPIEKVYMLEESQILTSELRRELLQRGHSRVPVYHKHRWNVKGLLYIKSLICIDSHERPIVGNLVRSNKSPIFCHPEMSLYDLLNEFQRGRHMAFITRNPQWHQLNWGSSPTETTCGTDSRKPSSWRAGFSRSPTTPVKDSAADEDDWTEEDDRALIGIATLEDVIEELIQEEIYDEFDNYNSSINDVAAPFTPGTKGASTLPLKFSFKPRTDELNDLTERLMPVEYASAASTAQPSSNTLAAFGRSNKDGVVVVKNLKTMLGINQARRSRRQDELVDIHCKLDTAIEVREEL